MDRATLQQFAAVKDAVAAVPGKLAKRAALAAYFRDLADDDLRLAVRYAGGRAFAATDERVLAVGGAIVWDVLLSILPAGHDELRRLTIASGEVGEAASKLWQPIAVERPLLLADLAAAFDDLAATGVQEQKRRIVSELLRRCATGREAAYLIKVVFREMRSGAQEGVLQAAVAEAFDRKLADVQRCQLLVGNLEEVALLAKHDRMCGATFRLFNPVQFMLASPQETPTDAAKTMAGRAFFVEDKLDGIRAQVHKQGERVAIYTRTMDRADDAFPEVVAAMRQVPGDFLIDGEIVPFAGGAVSPFAHLQRRLGRKKPTAGVLTKYPVRMIAFDLLYVNGALLMDEPLRVRRRKLEALSLMEASDLLPGGADIPVCLASGSGGIPAPRADAKREGKGTGAGEGEDQGRQECLPHQGEAARRFAITPIAEVREEADIAAAFEASKNRRNEGLILKDPDSIYSPGRRGKLWLKLKTHLPTLDCVVTAAEYGHGKRRNSLSDYTFAVWTSSDPGTDGAELLNIGKAYSGVTDAEIAQLTELFKSIAVADNGRVFQVRPQVVLEVAFDQVQRSSRHASGFALRFPRIKTVRWDKPPDQADTLARVEEIYQSAANTSRDAGAADDLDDAKPAEPTLFDHLP